jgi:hypothetical protein
MAKSSYEVLVKRKTLRRDTTSGNPYLSKIGAVAGHTVSTCDSEGAAVAHK